MKTCQSCKSYKNCLGKEWFSYSDFRWCVWQVIWVIQHSEVLRAGNWPLSPDGSSYIDPWIKTGYRSEAYFVKPEEILAEVEWRLKQTGKDGKLLWDEVVGGLELRPEAKDALMYVKGFRRKKQSYPDWLKQRNYRNDLERAGVTRSLLSG